MSNLDDELGTPRKISTAEEPEPVEAEVCLAGVPEVTGELHAAQDVIECLRELNMAYNYISYIADPTLTPTLTAAERQSAGRTCRRLKKFITELEFYYEG